MAKYKRQLRISQAVTTFGPGAVVDLRQESVMMAGSDFWPDDGPVDIHEPNLERALHVERFRMPAPNDEHPGKDLPFVVFPRWMVCPNCNRLERESFFRGIDGGNGPLKCPDCHKQVYPARLIVACTRGHIDDFPWVWWTHRDREKKCEKPQLFLRARGRTASLADLELSCTQCGARTNLAGATQQESLRGLICSGRRPWLQDEELCEQSIVCLQRGASNVYFSQSTSSISIPPWSRGIHALLNRHWLTLRAVPEYALAETVTGLNLPALLKLPVADVVQAIIDRKAETGGNQIQITESELRYREFQALSRDVASVGEYDDFKTRRTTVDPQLDGLIQKVVLVDRLREVRALLGFSRVSAPDPTNRLQGGTIAPLSAYPLAWLPGLEVHGEGIYLELDEMALQRWQSLSHMRERANLILERYEQMCNLRNWEPTRLITPRLLLTHSLAHALMRQLSLESGYSSAALRERLYVFEPDQIRIGSDPVAGMLIYTSTPDSEGSLGGLVRQGLPERFLNTLSAAINEAAWCSSDPLCIESEGQGHDAMNLAACHACMLISETSCEEFNRMLDRASIIGTPDHPSAGFFARLLEN